VARGHLIAEGAKKLAEAFGHYVRVHDERVPFTGEQLAAHRECIGLRRQAGGVRAAVSHERFVQALQRNSQAPTRRSEDH
jgi:hypothetical protein